MLPHARLSRVAPALPLAPHCRRHQLYVRMAHHHPRPLGRLCPCMLEFALTVCVARSPAPSRAPRDRGREQRRSRVVRNEARDDPRASVSRRVAAVRDAQRPLPGRAAHGERGGRRRVSGGAHGTAHAKPVPNTRAPARPLNGHMPRRQAHARPPHAGPSCEVVWLVAPPQSRTRVARCCLRMAIASYTTAAFEICCRWCT